MSATTGALISLEREAMLFHKFIRENAGKLKNLDDDDNIIFIPRLPKEVARLPKIKMGQDKIYSKLKLTLGVTPNTFEIVLLPILDLKVKHKKKKKKRSIFMDAATGRRLVGHFKPKHDSTEKY